MEFKQDDSCSVQKSSCFLEIPFFKLSLTKGTLYKADYTAFFSLGYVSPLCDKYCIKRATPWTF